MLMCLYITSIIIIICIPVYKPMEVFFNISAYFKITSCLWSFSSQLIFIYFYTTARTYTMANSGEKRCGVIDYIQWYNALSTSHTLPSDNPSQVTKHTNLIHLEQLSLSSLAPLFISVICDVSMEWQTYCKSTNFCYCFIFTIFTNEENLLN